MVISQRTYSCLNISWVGESSHLHSHCLKTCGHMWPRPPLNVGWCVSDVLDASWVFTPVLRTHVNVWAGPVRVLGIARLPFTYFLSIFEVTLSWFCDVTPTLCLYSHTLLVVLQQLTFRLIPERDASLSETSVACWHLPVCRSYFYAVISHW